MLVVCLAVSQCQGDWRRTNCLAAIGEELGQYNGKDCARLLINDNKWSEEGRSSSDYSLSDYQEWALIFSGAYYDVMTGIAQRNIDAGMDSAIALKEAGQEAMELLVKGLTYSENSYHGPITGAYDSYIYRKVAIAMLKVDAKENGCRAKDIITKVMRSRNILQEGDDASTILPYPRALSGIKTVNYS